MDIIKNIFKAIFIMIGGTVTVGITFSVLYGAVRLLIDFFIYFDLSYYFVATGYIIIYIIGMLIIIYSLYLFMGWVGTLIEKKRNKRE